MPRAQAKGKSHSPAPNELSGRVTSRRIFLAAIAALFVLSFLSCCSMIDVGRGRFVVEGCMVAVWLLSAIGLGWLIVSLFGLARERPTLLDAVTAAGMGLGVLSLAL